MCRISIYASAREPRGFRRYLKSFILGSLNDFVLDGYRRGRRTHGHGWGYAYVYGFGSDMGFSFYKTSLPITTDGIKKIALPKSFDWIMMVMHSRLTSSEPIDAVNSHPYYLQLPGKLSIWLVHNGAVDKNAIARYLGMEGVVGLYSDSFFLTLLLGRKIESVEHNSIVSAVKDIVEMNIVKSSLNFAAILLDDISKNVIGLAVNYVSEDHLNMFDYYTLYTVELGNGATAVASSTVALYLNRLYGYQAKPLNNKVMLLLRPERDSIRVDLRQL